MSKKRSILVDYIYYIVSVLALAFVLIFLIFTFLFRTSQVNGDSMNPNLVDKQRVILTSLNYKPERGDVVIISQPNAMDLNLIKRVIATEGQTVDIDTERGVVIVDGVALDEPYTIEPTYTAGDWDYPVTVPENCVFAMGDNRNNSTDSRFSSVGFIQEDYIVGHVIFKLNGLKLEKIKGNN